MGGFKADQRYSMVRSYTTDSQSLGQLLQTGWRQVRALQSRRRNITAEIAGALRHQEWFLNRAESMTGLRLSGIRALEIGHGQMPMAAAFVASRGNEAHGVDLDVLPTGLWDVAGYLSLLRTNGITRAIKTAGRELIGINSAMRKEFIRQLRLPRWPKLHLRQASATALPYDNESFDFVYSYHVLEHIDAPEAAVAEAIRVLRPGGALFFMFPHYAHFNALHDMRWITHSPNAPAPWAHLIPDLSDTVQQGAFVNTLRLAEWKHLFERLCPKATFDTTAMTDSQLQESLSSHRSHGRLTDFSTDELLTDDLVVAWRKPGLAPRSLQ